MAPELYTPVECWLLEMTHPDYFQALGSLGSESQTLFQNLYITFLIGMIRFRVRVRITSLWILFHCSFRSDLIRSNIVEDDQLELN